MHTALISMLIVGTLLVWAPAVAENALRFDGETGYVEVPAHATLDLGPEMTVEAWVRPLTFPVGPATIVDKGEGSESGSHNYYLRIDAENRVRFGYRTEDAGCDPQDIYAVSEYAFIEQDIGSWFHLAGQRTAEGLLEVYINGEPEGTADSSSDCPPPFVVSPVSIGASVLSPEGRPLELPFVGDMDEIRISLLARIEGMFTPPWVNDNDPATVALWHFDEGSGDVCYDSSGNDNDGHLIGGVQWVDPPAPVEACTWGKVKALFRQ
jgi:hypothetical protein